MSDECSNTDRSVQYVEPVENRAIEAYKQHLKDGSDYGSVWDEQAQLSRQNLAQAAREIAARRLKAYR